MVVQSRSAPKDKVSIPETEQEYYYQGKNKRKTISQG